MLDRLYLELDTLADAFGVYKVSPAVFEDSTALEREISCP